MARKAPRPISQHCPYLGKLPLCAPKPKRLVFTAARVLGLPIKSVVWKAKWRWGHVCADIASYRPRNGYSAVWEAQVRVSVVWCKYTGLCICKYGEGKSKDMAFRRQRFLERRQKNGEERTENGEVGKRTIRNTCWSNRCVSLSALQHVYGIWPCVHLLSAIFTPVVPISNIVKVNPEFRRCPRSGFDLQISTFHPIFHYVPRP